ncbi:MAG: DUF4003 family protein [Lachnospiraceae bacterium]|nr:DUF4003 family protein [Lachnospiraceae bacterium]
MNTQLQEKCELLAFNRSLVKKGFFWEYDLMRTVAAAIYTDADQTADTNRIKECRKMLRKRQGIFSDFRSYTELLVSTKMSLKDDPERYLEDVLEVYTSLRSGKFFTSQYMAHAALNICDLAQGYRTEIIAGRTRELMRGMRSAHPFLTSNEDMPFASLIACTEKDTDSLIEEIEACYQLLRSKFALHDDAVYSLAQVLSISTMEVTPKCQRVLDIYWALRDRGYKYGKSYELASLGTLIDLPLTADEIAEEIIDASLYLKTQKGFRGLDMDKRTRLMFAAMLVANVYAPEESSLSASITSSTVTTAVAEEIAVMIMMMMVSTSSSAAASS